MRHVAVKPTPTGLTKFMSGTAKPTRSSPMTGMMRRVAGIRSRFNGVEQILPADVSVRGPLAGMPYVAKDMIATGKVAPSWGCVEPMAAALPRASVIDRMEHAGACLIGTSVMTELAYES